MDWVRHSTSQFWQELTLSEVSGSLGDLGTFLPLLVGLVESRGLDLGTTLICTGIYNIASGLLFGVPMPVQPMKAIAAVALSEVALSVPEIMAAGIFVGVVVFILGITRLIDVVHSIIPTAVVRGLQLGVGLTLAQKGVSLVCFKDAKVGEIRDFGGAESVFLGLAAAAFILVTVFPYEKLELPLAFTKRPAEDEQVSDLGGVEEEGARTSIVSEALDDRWGVPAALIVVVFGMILTLCIHPRVAGSVTLGPSIPDLIIPNKSQWRKGIWRGGVAQLPLTLLNSVVAVCQLAQELFPNQAPSPMRVSVSVGLMNLLGPFLGALPCCHGAGGLAAQVRFGARSGAAPIFLGLVKLVLGLVFGSSLLLLLQAFPKSLLGSMLIFSGAELASTCRSQKGQRGCALMLLTTAAIMAVKNTAAGFLAGTAAALLLFLYDRAVKMWRKWSIMRDFDREQQRYQSLEPQSGTASP